MSTLAVNSITDANSGNTATINGMTPTADSLQGFRNRIINGDMRIDQRNAGASVTPSTSTSQYLVDRWKIDYSQTSKITAQQSTTAPVGFTNSLQLTVASAVTASASDYFLLAQPIEGFNIADLGFGSASAKTITISFQVRSSVTGTYAVTVRNSAANRTYIGTYTINSANTFESKSVTLVGDTSGTWLTNNGIGLNVLFDLGSGSDFNGTAGSWAGVNDFRTSSTTNWIANAGATFYITGVQLEVGSVATPFERLDYGRQLIQCQRYFQKTDVLGTGIANATTSIAAVTSFIQPMRATPTGLVGGTTWDMSDNYVADANASSPSIGVTYNSSATSYRYRLDGFTGLTAGRWYGYRPSTTSLIAFSAEL